MDSPFGSIVDAKYVYLTTHRKDGTPVGSPLWFAVDGSKLILWTVTDSWKVKRLRRNPDVTVQACSLRGDKRFGPIVTGRAEVVDGDGARRARTAVSRRYGIVGWFTVTGSLIRRGRDGSCGIVVTANPE
ncbi:PPOX class F420-dependent oxidoreductase [Skermania piniformis]|uniref:PPOX class F420-dependent oxidoreductase n=1 Tax=Skermania pinensis TaxID=39122 RepID=A0ABX8SEC8_9ACTN|nr:PPOX class F420-dependent oxidoreductase [Skermania piniformis]QXQ15507.1 PPOX class F420-dependent oxidoreductase [Skermania piniformis]